MFKRNVRLMVPLLLNDRNLRTNFVKIVSACNMYCGTFAVFHYTCRVLKISDNPLDGERIFNTELSIDLIEICVAVKMRGNERHLHFNP